MPAGSKHLTHLLSLALGLAVFVGALWILEREVGRYSLSEILAQMGSTPAWAVAAAAGFSALSYAQLVYYDALAQRYVGRTLPLGQTALTSFLSYVASHNLGLSGLGGTAMRFRAYSTWGFPPRDIAAIVVFCSVTYWLGLCALGGAVFLAAPSELFGDLFGGALSTAGVRGLGMVLWLLLGLFVVWTRFARQPVRIGGWSFAAPTPRLVAVQVPMAVVDWILSAAVVYVLLPDGVEVSPAGFLAVYVGAQFAGMISHVPGGLGVFESVLLAALPGDFRADELLGALLVYRVVYNLVPLFFGACAFAGFEAVYRRAHWRRTLDGLRPALLTLVPGVYALAALIGGLFLLLTGSTPQAGEPLGWMRGFLPLEGVSTSVFTGSLCGAGLLVLAHALHRRIDAAWGLMLVLLLIAALAAWRRGFAPAEATRLGGFLILLVLSRWAFYRRSRLVHHRLGRTWWVSLAFVVLGLAWSFLVVTRQDPELAGRIWWRYALSGEGSVSLRWSVASAGFLAVVGATRLLGLTPHRARRPSAGDLEQAAAIQSEHGPARSALVELGDFELQFSRSRRSFLAYRVIGHSWIAMGGPVGPAEEHGELIWRFRERSEYEGGRAAFFLLEERDLEDYRRAGLAVLRLGDRARLDLDAASEALAARGHRPTGRVVEGEELRRLAPRLDALDRAWIDAHPREVSAPLRAAGFRDRRPVVVFGPDDRPRAYAVLLAGRAGQELALDVVRTGPTAGPGALEALLAGAAAWGRDAGFRELDLGVAESLRDPSGAEGDLWSRLGELVLRQGDARSRGALRQAKDRLGPRWEPAYLAAEPGLDLPVVLADVAELVARDITGAFAR